MPIMSLEDKESVMEHPDSLALNGNEPTKNANELESRLKEPPFEIRKCLKDHLTNAISNNIDAKLIVAIGDHEFKCNLIVMEHYCSNIDCDWDSVKRICISSRNVSENGFAQAYKWMCAENTFKIQLQYTMEILKAAEFLGILELRDQCWAKIENVKNVKEEVAFFVYQQAMRVGIPHARDMLFMRIRKVFLPLVATTDFLKLPGDDVVELLASSFIGVRSELEVFMSAMRWLKHNWEHRELWLCKIVKCIRFALMSPYTLNCFCHDEKSFGDKYIIAIIREPKVKQAIAEGFVVHNVKAEMPLDVNAQEKFLALMKLQIPQPRLWIKTELNANCIKKDFITYKSFLEFLQKLKDEGPKLWRSFETCDEEVLRITPAISH